MKKLNLVIFTLLAVSIAACSGSETQDNNEDEPVGKSVNVETQVMQPETFKSQLRVVGNVETKNDIMISSEVSGRVVEQVVEEGEQVRKGQVLFRINDAKLQQEKARLQAATEQARENFERLQRIYEEDGIGSEMDVLNAKFNYQQNNSALKSIKVDIENTTIEAPFDGRVESFLLEEGEMASPGMQVVRLIGTDTYIVSAGVPARYADVVRSGQEVELWFDSQAPDTLDGVISYVGNSIDPQNRTFRIEVLLPSQNTNYKVDMIANLRLTTLTEQNVLVVTEEYIYKEEEEFMVFVKAEGGSDYPIAERRTVTLGPSYQSEVIIRSGLEVGDELITTGSAFLNDGARLNIVESNGNNLASQ
ncbi:MAG: efflux RND transporter periplasmic adaptor subunit [Gracilimonas sp.]|uniref:efflux RND transporter periplasmic adaptor subunit n=1 Tax=Gracilimonas sp. TaxID=1974203 RepID=UPI00375005FC|nr:efflux RND transporter periplasmic adaptor subunit [Gracilimonas sp.]